MKIQEYISKIQLINNLTALLLNRCNQYRLYLSLKKANSGHQIMQNHLGAAPDNLLLPACGGEK